MHRLLILAILIGACWGPAGCGVTFDQDLADARAACPSLSTTEFNLLIETLEVGRASGTGRDDIVAGIPEDCTTEPTGFPDEIECRECLVAATIAVFGQ